MCGRVGHLDAAARIDHQYRIGEGIDGRLAGALGAQQAGGVRLAIVAQLPGHEVERLGKVSDLIVRMPPAPPD